MKLRPYQKEAVEFISNKFIAHNQRGFLLADPTGLGKGVQALKIIEKVLFSPVHPHALIICPSFLKSKWIDEIKTKLPKKRKYLITIKTYNEVSDPQWQRMVMRHKYEILIIDESHYLKDFESLRTKAVFGFPGGQSKPIISVCKYILCLTATPYPNRIGEIYPFLWAMKHPLMFNLTYEDFIAHWAESYRFTQYGIQHRGVKNSDEFKSKIKNIFLRREKKDVLKDLPDAVRNEIPIECNSGIYKEEENLLTELLLKSGYSKFQTQTLLKSPDLLDTIIELMPSFEKLTLFKHQQGLLKIKPIFDYLAENILIDPEQQKFILLTYHTDIAEKYKELIEKEKKDLPVLLVTGQTPKDLRFEIIKKANEMSCCVLIASMHSVKEGLDFIGFSTTYFAEIDWSPSLLTQCEGRTHRIGQKNKVIWNYFIYGQGIERYIFDMLKDKNKTIEKLLK